MLTNKSNDTKLTMTLKRLKSKYYPVEKEYFFIAKQ